MLPNRFWTHVNKTATCWLWTAYICPDGYGRTAKGKTAHRLSYEDAKGPIPDGLVIDHLCRVRNCVNPDHLEPVTVRENTRRGIGHGKESHCPAGHEYDAANTYVDPRGCRRCRMCGNESARRYQRRKSERKAA